MGRPSHYKPEYAAQAGKLCRLGATDQEVAEFFDVGHRTVDRWKATIPEFAAALNLGKEPADERVERSLYHKAIGYTFNAEEVFQYQGKVVRAQVVKHVPPDTTACIFWLKNRRPLDWRDVHKHEHSQDGALGDRLVEAVQRVGMPKTNGTTEH